MVGGLMIVLNKRFAGLWIDSSGSPLLDEICVLEGSAKKNEKTTGFPHIVQQQKPLTRNTSKQHSPENAFIFTGAIDASGKGNRNICTPHVAARII